MKKKSEMVEIWGDVVDIFSLLITIFISIITTMGFYFIADSANKTSQLFFGLAGAVLGLLISSLLIKPKRNIIVAKEKQ